MGDAPLAFAFNSRDVLRDLHDVSSALLTTQSQNFQTMIYENHGIAARYSGPLDVSPTISARCGTGGNNLPLVSREAYCIAGNTINRSDDSGGNGDGFQKELAYTLDTQGAHAVFAGNGLAGYRESDVVSTEIAGQHKMITDLIMPRVFGQTAYAQYDESIATLRACGGSQGGGSENLAIEADGQTKLVRRLTPLECERLQGLPDFWTDVANASDAARYKALGNSVAIPCVEYVMRGIAYFINLQNGKDG